MMKKITIAMMITNEMERPMISLLLYLFSSLLVSSKVILVMLSISLTTVGLGVTVSVGSMLTTLVSSSTTAGVWVTVGVCVDTIDGVGVGVGVLVCTVKQNNKYW